MSIIQPLFKTKLSVFLSFFLLIFLFCVPGRAESDLASSSERRINGVEVDLGAYYWNKGNITQAISIWKKQAQIYQAQKLYHKEAELTLLIAQGYTKLGQFHLATFQLNKILSFVKEPSLLGQTWKQLGDTYNRSGEFDQALSAYKQSLKLKTSLSTLNNLVILLQKQVKTTQLKADSSKEGAESQKYFASAQIYQLEALKYAQQALHLSQTEESASSVRTLIEWSKVSSTKLSSEQLERGRRVLTNLPNSTTKAFLSLNWGQLDEEKTHYWLTQAVEVAQKIEDVRAESYGFLELGLLAEKSANFLQALDYAHLAQIKAHSKSAYDSLYRAYWLSGRIYQKMGQIEKAIAFYQKAIFSLSSLNQASINIDIEQRLNFSEKIEPIYRTTLELLLSDSNLSESQISEALAVFEQLRLAQLQNYFGDNCVQISPQKLATGETLTRKNAVLLSSIILENQTHLILELPNGQLLHHRVPISESELRKMAVDWYQKLKKGESWQLGVLSQKLYKMIILPFEVELQQIKPNTIIFVHDGILRNIPMAALNDGKQFLVEKWASVSSLGLNFVSTANSKKVSKPKAAVFGLGIQRRGWNALSQVLKEVGDVIEIIDGRKFLDREFTAENFEQQLNRHEYSVVHVSSHGYAGGVAENSFVVAYDRNISALDLESILSRSKSSIEMLVLSACETSLSSDRSILGLAGVGLRSGINSVLGSLWLVDDEKQAELIHDFYTQIQESNFDKAKALQLAQIKQIRSRTHPSLWSALTLLGEG
ncbi:MAG: CHAT domain-containing protein [Prochloraceae cyanobacterium]|nr:CHAT domain-containing protein [Prochloraceae cyanobacterium]